MTTERQAAGAHGTAVVKRLAADLQAEFPGIVGFSWRNLFNMSEFFTAYRDKPKLQPLAAIIGWTQNLVILQRCKEPLEREFYLRMTAKFGWTKNVLIHQVENQSYEKTLLGQTNFDKALTPKLCGQAKLAVRDEYTFDFLELGEEHADRELERALVGRIQQFLRAMGGLFAFVGRSGGEDPGKLRGAGHMSWTPKHLDQLGNLSRGRSRHRPRDAAHLYVGPYPFI